MKMLTFHDHLNPDQEVMVNPEQIASVSPFASGSTIQLLDAGPVCVHETPDEVASLLESQE